MFPTYYRQPEIAPASEYVETFPLYYGIAPVVIIYGNARRLHADEHNHAGRLLKTLDWLGREGIAIRGMIRGDRCLCRSSVRALNLYLRHGNGLAAFRRIHPRHYPFDRYAWADLQRLVGIRWIY